MPLIYISCAWLAGIWLGSIFYLTPALILTGIIPLPLLFFIRQRRKTTILVSLALFALFTAATYSYSSQHKVDESSLRFYNDHGIVTIKGMVVQDPEVRDKSTHLNFSVTGIKLDDSRNTIEGNVLIFVPRYPEYRYGDVLQATGKLETPGQLDDFDYRGYLAHQGIYTTMLYPEIATLERERGFKPLAWVYILRNNMAQTIVRVLPEPQASLGQAIILGIRGNIPSPLKDNFIRSGTAHLLAISGLHLSIIAGILLSAGVWLFGRRYYLYIWLALGIIWLYAMLTGMHPPIVRGAIMASLFLTAELMGRQRSALTALTFAAAVMAGISPYILADASFQLSFLAMAGLVFFFPTLRNLGRKAVQTTIGEEGTVATIANIATDSLSATMAALVAVWPVIAYYFGIISLVGPLATFLLLPALPGIIIIGALTGLLGLIALPAAQIMGWLTYVFLLYMTAVVSGLAIPSLSSIEVSSINPAFIWAYYSVLAVIIWLKSSRYQLPNPIPNATTRLGSSINASSRFISGLPMKWIIPPLLVTAILISMAAAAMPDAKLHVSFLNVGQGDAILIQQGTRQILVDGGPSPLAISRQLSNQMPFWDKTIDLLVLTHPHQDHLTGLVEVLRRFRVRQVIYPDLTDNSPTYLQWHQIIEEKNIKETIAHHGQQIRLGGDITIKVLNPRKTITDESPSDLNNDSVVLHLSAGDVSFLLTADILKEREWELIQDRARLTSTVLKVPHHGADTSTTPQFLAVVNPQLAVISVGADNKFGHPNDEVLAKLEQKLGQENVYRTDEHGTIEFITDGERLWVRTEDN
ncbi:DNA internalization-related competence protein ComEC/Rec2 [Chloroflexota bacterium]